MNNKENLLIVSRSTVFHNKSGGMETQLDNLINYLKDYYNITVLTTALPFDKNPPEINQKKLRNEVKYIFLKDTIPGEYGYSLYESLLWQIPIKRNSYSINKVFTKKAAKYFKDKLKDDFKLILSQSSSAQDFDISNNENLVLVNHGTTLNEISNRFQSLYSIKDYIRFIFLDIPELLYEYLINNKLLFKKADEIILLTEELKNDFVRQHGYKEKITIIPNGINTNKFKPKKKDDLFRVVYFGRIDYEKGIDDFLIVAKKLNDIQFELYGDGPDKEDLENSIKKEELGNVEYYGSVPNEKIAEVLAKSHIFLFLTKRKEGMPMSILESLSSGCVVISTLNNQLDRQSGYIKISKVNGAIGQITKLKSNMNLFNELSNNARVHAEENYSYEAMGEKYKQLLEKIE